MSPKNRIAPTSDDHELETDVRVPTVVVVDPDFASYKPLAASARLGKLNLHFRSSGAEAIRFARRLKVDAWLVAPDLDDISGADFIELLTSRIGASQLAIVEAAASGSAGRRPAERTETGVGAAAMLSPPITFRDLERLLGMPADERGVVLPESSTVSQMLVTLPVGVSAAAVAVAVLMLS